MAPPTNISFLTATDLTSLPETINQTADDAGTTYDLYFRIPSALITAQVKELSIFGFGDLTVYTPTVRAYVGPAASPVQIVRPGSDDPKGTNITIQVPVDTGNDYFVKVSTNAGNPSPAALVLTIRAASNDFILSGDIVIPDDTVLYPLAVLNPNTDYAIRRFIHPYSASEQGDVLHTSGKSLMSREPTGVAIDKLAFYDEQYAYVSTLSFSPAIGNIEPYIRTNQSTQRFAVIYFNDPTTYSFFINSSGVASAVENMGDVYGNAGEAPGPVTTSPDESIIYWAVRSDSKIYSWDLVSHAAIGTWKAAVASYRVGDLLTLSNGEILIGYFKSSATLDYNVKHFSADGTLLHTYNFGSDIRAVTPRLAHSIDNLTSFWVYVPRPSSGANRGKSNVYQVRISDGVYLTDRVYAMYETGEYEGAATATPLAPFGASNSCPFWIAASSAPAMSGLYTVSGTGAGFDPLSPSSGPNPLLRHDQNWIDTLAGTSENVKIPDPYYDTFLAGDE